MHSCKVAKCQSAKVTKCQSYEVQVWQIESAKLAICHSWNVPNIRQNCLSLSLSCLCHDRHGDTHAALNLHLLPPIQRCAHIFEQPPPCDLCMCSCKQDCYHGRHLKPPTHLQIYCLLENCRVELGSVWLFGLRGDMMVPLKESNSVHFIWSPEL